MIRSARIGLVGIAAVAGVVAAVGVAAGEDDVKGCLNKAAGTLRVAGDSGRCLRGEVAVTAKGGKTLTINGVAFKAPKSGTLTINGTAFKSGRNQTLTINGVAFKGGRGQTLTINGTAFAPGAATRIGPTGPAGPVGAQGVAGAAGLRGPTGTSGPIGGSAALVERAGPVTVTSGAGAIELAGATFTNTDGKQHRLLVTGGFNADCGDCDGVHSSWTLGIDGAIEPLVTRRLSALGKHSPETGASVSEVVVAPAVCNPCTVSLAYAASGGTGSGTIPAVAASEIRLAVVDLGPG